MVIACQSVLTRRAGNSAPWPFGAFGPASRARAARDAIDIHGLLGDLCEATVDFPVETVETVDDTKQAGVKILQSTAFDPAHQLDNVEAIHPAAQASTAVEQFAAAFSDHAD